MNPDHAHSGSWATGIATVTNCFAQWLPDKFRLVPTPSSIGPAPLAWGQFLCRSCFFKLGVSLPILKFHEDA